MKKKKTQLIPKEEEVLLEENKVKNALDETEGAPAPEKEEENEAGKEEVLRKMEEDIELFHSLFPEVKGEEIPQEVWDRVEMGESLAAAYSLFVIKTQREEEKIRAVNEENEKKAPPRIRHDGAEAEYFSPEAVRSMSRSEIKKNYDAILRSMEKWN